MRRIPALALAIATLGFAAAAQAGALPSLPAPPTLPPVISTTAAPAQAPGEASAASPTASQSKKTEIVWEWDPYYTDVDFNIPLTDKPIPTISSDSEAVIYRDLITGSLVPRYMLFEASVYPLPVLGTYLNTHTPGFWNAGQIGNGGINVFKSATAGFQEPWALSAFFGNIANLVKPGETSTGQNLGYTGYLISAGAQHIKDDVLIQDKWYELEWKIKGKLDYPDEKLDWSFRVGAKMNANHDITNVMYVGIHRSNLDFHQPFLSWLANSDVDLQIQFSQQGGKPLYEELVIGKKYPVEGEDYSITLDVGLVWESPDEYQGILRDTNTSTLTLVFRPSIEF
jgi:hypothetical protein